MQHMEYGRAVDAQRGPGGFEVVEAHVQHDPAPPRLASDDVDQRLAQGLDLSGQAQPVEDVQAGRLEHEAGADGFGLIEPFVDHDLPALSRQDQGGGETGGTGTDDRDRPRT